MINLDDVLLSLSYQRPIFHSEADFQHALAWQIHLQHPDAHVRLEYRPFSEEPLYLDLWVQDTGDTLAIELKYATTRLLAEHAGERFSLNNQAAQPIKRHDFVKDIARLERVVEAVPNIEGYAILLTNDSGYWTLSRHTDTVDAAFRIHDGARLNGSLTWSAEVGAGTSKKREGMLDLRGSYPVVWHDYSSLIYDQRPGRFRYVSIRVDRHAAREPVEKSRSPLNLSSFLLGTGQNV